MGRCALRKHVINPVLQPIIGMAVTITPPEGLPPTIGAFPGLLVLLATGPVGYRSLSRLSTNIQARADRDDVRRRGISLDVLAEHRIGLICIGGGRRGWVERLLRAGEEQAAARYLSRLAGIYDEDVYLALERQRTNQQPTINSQQSAINEKRSVENAMLALAQRFGVPTVAAQPVYTLAPDHRDRLHLLAAIDHNTPLTKLDPATLPDGGDRRIDLHWLSPDELAGRFVELPDALAETNRIAAHCQPALPDGRPIWPALDLPSDQTSESALAGLAKQGLERKYGLDVSVEQRLAYELDSIARHGYSPLFLLVADIVRHARSQSIPVSTRGSVANSLVAYCTGITTVDPIRHNLLFERFLNPARRDPPDIDLDFCSIRRDEVLKYVRRKYGEDKVALVATISTMRPKSALRETGKALGLDEDSVDQLAKRLPRGWHPALRYRSDEAMQELLDSLEDGKQRSVVRQALGIVGQPHHLSVHPGGIVISPGPMTDVAPLQLAPKGFLITQYDHKDVEAIGLPKIDLLGIRALSVLADAAELVRQHHDPDFRLEIISLDDPTTGDLIARGDTVGVFQCDSSGAQRTLRKLQAREIGDMAIANAFFKPGPALGGMAQRFVRRYRGQEPVSYLHPSLKPILAHTKGVLIFQEQILRIATEVAGLSWDQANQLRRGMSKFQADEIATLQTQFIEGCVRPVPDGPGMSKHQAQTLWEQVEPFSGYGFNQGHATAYADVSYRSAYLKAHYPAAFFAARLANRGGFHHPAIYMAEAVRQGITLHPPHVNRSDSRFTLTWEPGPAGESEPHLWMGLGQVRDLRRESVKAIIAQRELHSYADLRDFMVRTPLQRKEITHLVQCGALDGLGINRAAMLAEADVLTRSGSAQQMAFEFFQVEAKLEKPAQKLAWERRILGLPMSVHPLSLFSSDQLQAYSTTPIIPLTALAKTPGRQITTVGVRLPGWTGGDGFFLGDEANYVIAISAKETQSPPVWEPIIVRGRWRVDEWGGGWLQVEEWGSVDT